MKITPGVVFPMYFYHWARSRTTCLFVEHNWLMDQKSGDVTSWYMDSIHRFFLNRVLYVSQVVFSPGFLNPSNPVSAKPWLLRLRWRFRIFYERLPAPAKKRKVSVTPLKGRGFSWWWWMWAPRDHGPNGDPSQRAENRELFLDDVWFQ